MKSNNLNDFCQQSDNCRELWCEPEGDYYADSIHVTAPGSIGINCGGTVVIKSLRAWHQCDAELRDLRKRNADLAEEIAGLRLDGTTLKNAASDMAKRLRETREDRMRAKNALRALREDVEPVLRTVNVDASCIRGLLTCPDDECQVDHYDVAIWTATKIEAAITDILARHYDKKEPTK